MFVFLKPRTEKYEGTEVHNSFTAKSSLYQVLFRVLDLTIETACVYRKGIVLTPAD